MFDQTLIRICLIFGSLVTAWYILRRVRQAKVQIEDTIFWLLFSAALLILAIFPGIAYWAANLLGFMSPINFVYVVIIFFAAGQAVLHVHPPQPAGQQSPHPDRAGRPQRGKKSSGKN